MQQLGGVGGRTCVQTILFAVAPQIGIDPNKGLVGKSAGKVDVQRRLSTPTLSQLRNFGCQNRSQSTVSPS